MSDYYGNATLEDWLQEEVFGASNPLPQPVVSLFEKWRTGVENNIEAWMDSDDGYGNNLSWRGWGRGFYSIPESENDAFNKAIEAGYRMLAIGNSAQPVPVTERLPDPKDCDSMGRCWWFRVGEDGVGDWTQQTPYRSATSYAFFRMTHWLPFYSLPTPDNGTTY